MIPGLSNRRRFSDLSEQEVLALAISSVWRKKRTRIANC